MTSTEFDDLADVLQAQFAARVKVVGASYTIRQMAEEIREASNVSGRVISEETLRRLMNKRIKKRGLDIKTIRALVRRYGRIINDTLDISPDKCRPT